MKPWGLVRYGQHPDQVANLHLPDGTPPFAVVVLIHGGFWRDRHDRTLMTPLAQDLAARGYLAWNVEYRRVGQEGGGWPGTFDDLAAAVHALAGVAEADRERVVAVGHSAGGHLALWLAARGLVAAAASQAGVADLVAGADLGDGAARALLGGGPDEVPDRYAAASPAARLPLGVPQLLVHGRRDDVVPPGQSERYAEAAAAAGDRVELALLPDADHFDVIDPAHEAWRLTVEWIARTLPPRP
jgi:acetyl esterase/lipase